MNDPSNVPGEGQFKGIVSQLKRLQKATQKTAHLGGVPSPATQVLWGVLCSPLKL